jgi:hypothetical protein
VRGAGLTILPSPLEGVSDGAWTTFADRMRTQAFGAVSPSNAIGAWAIKPRRLADLGLVMNLQQMRDQRTNRMIWTGQFMAPLTAKGFLADPKVQYNVLSKSMADYVEKLRSGAIPKPDGGRPDGLTFSGILAILHRCGPSGLKNWNDPAKRFEDTEKLVSKVNGVF